MKIAQVISTPPGAWATGGCAKVAFDLSKALVNLGHDVTILSIDIENNQQCEKSDTGPVIIDGIKIFKFQCISQFLSLKYKFYISFELINYLKNHISEFDIVHLQDLISIQSIATAYYCKKYHIPYILTTHGSLPWLTKKSVINYMYYTIFGKKILINAENITVQNQTEYNQYLQLGLHSTEKIVIIPNGIDISEYEMLPKHGNFRKRYGITSDEKVVLYLGRLHKIKGIDFLVNGFSNLSGQYTKAKLVIAGPDDGYLDMLLNQVKKLKIEDKTIFTGPLYGDEKKEAYVDADLLVYPGMIEIFGLVPFEAIMCGTPVIVCDDCGCGELINEAKCGYIVHYGDISGLIETLRNALEHLKVNREMVASGKQYILERLTWERISKQVEATYEDCIHHI